MKNSPSLKTFILLFSAEQLKTKNGRMAESQQCKNAFSSKEFMGSASMQSSANIHSGLLPTR